MGQVDDNGGDVISTARHLCVPSPRADVDKLLASLARTTDHTLLDGLLVLHHIPYTVGGQDQPRVLIVEEPARDIRRGDDEWVHLRAERDARSWASAHG